MKPIRIAQVRQEDEDHSSQLLNCVPLLLQTSDAASHQILSSDLTGSRDRVLSSSVDPRHHQQGDAFALATANAAVSAALRRASAALLVSTSDASLVSLPEFRSEISENRRLFNSFPEVLLSGSGSDSHAPYLGATSKSDNATYTPSALRDAQYQIGASQEDHQNSALQNSAPRPSQSPCSPLQPLATSVAKATTSSHERPPDASVAVSHIHTSSSGSHRIHTSAFGSHHTRTPHQVLVLRSPQVNALRSASSKQLLQVTPHTTSSLQNTNTPSLTGL